MERARIDFYSSHSMVQVGSDVLVTQGQRWCKEAILLQEDECGLGITNTSTQLAFIICFGMVLHHFTLSKVVERLQCMVDKLTFVSCCIVCLCYFLSVTLLLGLLKLDYV